MVLRMPPLPADLIGTAEAARLLGIAPVTVTRWVADGTLMLAHKLPTKNGAMLFDRAHVEALAAERSPAEVSQ